MQTIYQYYGKDAFHEILNLPRLLLSFLYKEKEKSSKLFTAEFQTLQKLNTTCSEISISSPAKKKETYVELRGKSG